jgi:hypothetical protein
MTQRLYPPASIEHDSPMTRDGEYRSKLLKLLADQARAELEPSNIYSRWIAKAPGPEERMHLAEIAKEETEHWYGTIKILEGLGVSPQEANGEWATNHWFYTLVHIVIPRYRWEDILMLTFLIDLALSCWSKILRKAVMLPGRALLNKCSQKKWVMWTSATTSFALKSKSSAPRGCNERSTNGGASRSTPLARLSRSTRRNTSSLDLSFAATKTTEKPFGAAARRRFVSWACRS